MKTIKKIALLAFSLGLSSVASASVLNVIKVNTFTDELLSTSKNCSLRAAVEAVNSNRIYAGCAAGLKGGDNVIQLPAGNYPLSMGVINLLLPVTIAGPDTRRPDIINPYTGYKPSRIRPNDPVVGVAITATAGARIFTATAGVTIRDLVLTGNGLFGSFPANDNNSSGALMMTSGSVTLDNVIAQNGHAIGNGGAIYLATDGAGLTATDTSFENNMADAGTAGGLGGTVAMSCAPDNVGPPSQHAISISRSLFLNNSSGAGAAVLALCANSSASLISTTLSDNVSAATSAAIDFQQPIALKGLGSLSLTSVTAIGNTNGVLLFRDINSAVVSASFLALNVGNACKPSVGVANGGYNATDNSCTSVLAANTTNQVVNTPLATEFQSAPATPSVYLDYHGGLTKNYLPNVTAQFVTDNGGPLTGCVGNDQRNLPRLGGGQCDIGAVELLQPTAGDVDASSVFGTDRLAIVDVLASSTFGETAAGPNGYATIAVVVDSVTAPGTCVWHDNADPIEKYKNKLVVGSVGGVTTTTATPIKCTYHVVDGGMPGASSPTAIVTTLINNAPPDPKPDTYLRPQGTSAITFNPLLNDNDDGDGIYGAGPAIWHSHPIHLDTEPTLGVITGASRGNCPDWTTTNLKVCFTPPLTYTAFNNDSPFSDNFTYSVYDKDEKPSSPVAITINTDAVDLDSGGGSWDWIGALSLLLIGLRRRRTL